MPLRRIVKLLAVIIRSRGDAHVAEQPSEDSVGVEVHFGDGPRGLAMSIVISRDPLRSVDGFVQGAEGQQAFADRQIATEAGILDQGRLAASQVANGSIAEPA